MSHEIPSCVLAILEKLDFHALPSYLAGGCVRDLLMGNPPSDWDICTPATPEELIAIFPSFIPLGLKFGTIGLSTPEGIVEITSFREESNYCNHRHPQVSFVRSLETDLARRDFTINAMAYNPQRGLVDLFEGQRDLKEGILRCVGNPFVRFQEDALRILRLVRFSCVHGFYPDLATLHEAKMHKSSLLHISQERIRNELILALKGKFFADFFETYFEIFQIVLPELTTAKRHTITDIPLLFAFLFGKEEDCRALERLKFSRLQIQQAHQLLKYKNTPLRADRAEIKFLLQKIGENQFKTLLELKKLNGEDITKLRNLTQEILRNHECFSLRDLQIKGDDLMRLGLEGKEIGEVLNHLLIKVIKGEIENTCGCLKASAFSLAYKKERLDRD